MLSEYLAKPFFQSIKFGEATMVQAAPQVDKYLQETSQSVVADEHALKFYLLNHVFSIILAKYDQGEELPPEVDKLAQQYVSHSTEMSLRAFYYLYIICCREARHFGGGSKTSVSIAKQVTNLYGKEVWKKVDWMCHSSSGDIVDALRYSSSDISLVGLVSGLRIVFHEGAWNGSYGGPKWGAITDCLYHFLNGTYSAEMMMDTVWTLSHNNGPIFNKPFLYNGYTHVLGTILDVQRSGQIPQLFYDRMNGLSYLDNDPIDNVQSLYNSIIHKVDWPELRGHIDWWRVEMLGAVNTYQSFKATQKHKFGASVYDKAEMKAVPNTTDSVTPGIQNIPKYGVYNIGDKPYTKIKMKRAA